MINIIRVVFILSSIGLIAACTSKQKQEDSSKFQRYYFQGEQLFRKHCSNCHQANGKGLGRLYPPLDKSDFVDQNVSAVLCTMRFGREGALIVNGVDFNQKMPANPTLSDLEIAEIATYIYNNWGRTKGLINVHEVTAAIDTCSNGNQLKM